MIDHPITTTTTINAGYAESILHRDDAVTTTPTLFALTSPPVTRRCPGDRRQSPSAASMLRRYSPPARTQLSRAVVAGATFYSLTRDDRDWSFPAGNENPDQRVLPRSRREKNAEAIALLDRWLADESGYDENTWPTLREGIDCSRTSARKRFCD